MSASRSIRLCLACVFLGIASAGAAMDLPALVSQTDTSAGATVYLVPPMAIFVESLDETRMQAAACRFATTDPADVRALVALLQSGGLRDNAVYQRPDVREGVYLRLADGKQLKVLLQDHGGTLPINGVAETSIGGSLQSVGLVAQSTLSADVRKWAATRGGTRTGSACDRLVPVSLTPEQ